MNERIGVYVCQCGSNISDYVDVEAVREAAEKEEGVTLAKTTMFACSDSAQNEMIEDIRSNGLDAMVVASCSPKLHLYTFRSVAERAGLNPYNYVQANIREQGSWAHSDKPDAATEKAITVVRGAISRARLSAALTPSAIPAENAVLVIGAGISGMKAAVELAGMGSHVYLIEETDYVGGRVGQWGELFPGPEAGGDLTARLYDEVKRNDRINIFTGARISSASGSVGNFEVKLKISPRFIDMRGKGVDPPELGADIGRAVEACPVEIPDEFDFGLTTRKAFGRSRPGLYPELPSIDRESCTRCGECAKILEIVNLEALEETMDIKVGAIVACTGFDPYEPKEGEFGYGTIDNVITLQQFMRLMELEGGGTLDFKGREIRNISYIYCVGSRQVDGDNKYCSRYCCAAAIHAANMARKKFGGVRNFHFHRGIRSYGKLEELYTDSSKAGDIYLQSSDDDLPEVVKEDGAAIVKIKDILTSGRELEVESDLVVLVTSMVPRDNAELVEILKVPVGLDGFFNEVHPKLKPVEVVIDGIFIAGACQFPRNITETMNSALSASIKASSLVSGGEIELEPTVAKVDRSICGWCGECAGICPFEAIVKTEYEGKEVAEVNEANCKGCGMCLPVCSVNAIQLIGYTDSEIEALIDTLAE